MTELQDHHVPKSVCPYCEALTLRLPTRQEIIALRVSPDWKRIWQANLVLSKMKDRPKPPRYQ